MGSQLVRHGGKIPHWLLPKDGLVYMNTLGEDSFQTERHIFFRHPNFYYALEDEHLMFLLWAIEY
jgi:hypothetical protein